MLLLKKKLMSALVKLKENGIEFIEPDIKNTVTAEFLRKAFVKTITTLVLYHPSSKEEYLLVASSNKNIANSAISTLIKACGSVKTETIHIDDVSQGLTTRLLNTLNNEEENGLFLEKFLPTGQFLFT